MVLPDHIVQAAKDGDIAVVEAFLDAEPGAINDRDEESELTLLMLCMNSSIKERHIWFARRLIVSGADVNVGDFEDNFPLHYAPDPHYHETTIKIRETLLNLRKNLGWESC